MAEDQVREAGECHCGCGWKGAPEAALWAARLRVVDEPAWRAPEQRTPASRVVNAAPAAHLATRLTAALRQRARG